MSEAFVQHFSSVSAHGLSKFAGAKRLSSRVLWLVLFIASSTAFIAHISLLVSRFQGKPISTQLTVQALDFQSPRIVACSPFPLSYSWVMFANEAYPKDFGQSRQFIARINGTIPRIMDVANKLAANGQDVLRMQEFPNSSWSVFTSVIYSSLISLRTFQPPSKYQFIVKAAVNNKEMDINSFETISSQEYHTCYRFKNSTLLKHPTDLLTIYFYTDASRGSEIDGDASYYASLTYSGLTVDDKSSGVLLFFTESGYYAGTEVKQITASCGMHTKVSVSMTANSMVNTKMNMCGKKARTVTLASHLIEGANDTYKLDRSLCEAYEWALEYYNQCGCVPLRYPIPAHVKANTSRCLNVTRWSLDKIIDNIKCMSRVQFASDVQQRIMSRCKGIDPCERLGYNVHWSNALWPTSSLATKFTKNVLNETYLKRIRKNRPVPAWINVLSTAENTFTNTIMIRENIAKVDIRPSSRLSDRLSESPAYPAMNLFSDIGGILGLYLGMSLLTVFELLESIIFTFQQLQKAKRVTTEIT